MPENKAPPQIFDAALIECRRKRAAVRVQKHGGSFIMQRCAEDAAERLCDINRQFENALLIAPEDFSNALLTALPARKKPQYIARIDDVMAVKDIAEGQYDLVISAFGLHSVDDLPGALIRSKMSLKPDGLFLGAMFGGQTLSELRRAAYHADEAIFGGMSARVYPFADYSQAANLLQRSGFALPVIDMDKFTVRYGDLKRLVADLRDLGQTNALLGRDARYVGKAYWNVLKSAYALSETGDGKFPATFEILWMTGWSPHESQQKPLKPGSAKMRLADALGTREQKL